VNLKSYALIYEARGTDTGSLLTAILGAMDQENRHLEDVERDTIGVVERASFTVTANRRGHESLQSRLKAETAIDELKTFRDPEED
jgi:putative Mg2+ transporter-C (MgtC) family protein